MPHQNSDLLEINLYQAREKNTAAFMIYVHIQC